MGGKNGYWRRHPKKELQALLMEFHEAGWRVLDPEKGGGYYKVRCACGAHKTSVHLSPSNPNYKLDKQKWLRRQECYN